MRHMLLPANELDISPDTRSYPKPSFHEKAVKSIEDSSSSIFSICGGCGIVLPSGLGGVLVHVLIRSYPQRVGTLLSWMLGSSILR
jgi:hypothetical protein